MKLIAISSPIAIPNEHEIINSLFEEGLEIFHLHKTSFSKEEIKKFVQQIPFKYHNRIALHSDFPKFHSLKELEASSLPGGEGWGGAEYAFLSPVFDSISKAGYKSNFDLKTLQKSLRLLKCENSPLLRRGVGPACRTGRGEAIIALGGIDEDKIEITRELGFAGVAVLGAIWNSKNPIEKFLRIKAKCQKKDLVF